MWSEQIKCLDAGQTPRFSDIHRNGRHYEGAYEKSTPKGARHCKTHRITRDELRQKAKQVAQGFIAILALSLSMIVDINF